MCVCVPVLVCVCVCVCVCVYLRVESEVLYEPSCSLSTFHLREAAQEPPTHSIVTITRKV